MKVHLAQPQILLLQTIGDGRNFIGQQRMQIAFLASDHQAYVAGMHHGADFDAAKCGRIQSHPHLRLRGPAGHLCYLYRAHAGGSGVGR